MGKAKSFKSKAVHFVSDLTTVFLNPISDKPSSKPPPHAHHPPTVDLNESIKNQHESISEEDTGDLVDGPDTSSFTAFLYSLLSSSESGDNSNADEKNDNIAEMVNQLSDNVRKESGTRKGLLSRGKQSLKAIYHATRIGGYRGQERKGNSDMIIADESDDNFYGLEMKNMQPVKEPVELGDLPDMSEPSLLLSEKARSVLYASLPALVHGRKWLMLYSTWRHGISLSTLYRRSMLWPGLSLLVVGDRKGAVFGGLVEAPLRPTNKRKYQGTNSTFVFTNTPGDPVIFRPTGANRYFTLCTTDFLAIGGGGHFALYLDGDLLNGSSSVSETYGNPCLARSEDFEVKEVELWGFVYGTKYEEILALSRTEAPGICRW
ncbi:oxidation resistance protein 1 isoform X2 [Ricinus communis]|uniref:oxidation resistance protein 1 isoform X2 n=1 Tax=Ricinus communis TaxID=3988 RepID=UPI00201A73FA|nr:oxidation resistance protein 1 isoform X2 [Ricinus communis]